MKHLPVLCRNAYFAPSVSRQLGSGHEPDLEQSVRFNQRRQDEINMFSRNHLSFSTLFLDKPRICIDIYIYIKYILYINNYIYIHNMCRLFISRISANCQKNEHVQPPLLTFARSFWAFARNIFPLPVARKIASQPARLKCWCIFFQSSKLMLSKQAGMTKSRAMRSPLDSIQGKEALIICKSTQQLLGILWHWQYIFESRR